MSERVRPATFPVAESAPPRQTWRSALRMRLRQIRRLLARRSIAISLALLAATIVPALVAPFFISTSPNAQTLNFLDPPSFDHWLGTDSFGRDVLTRVLYGTRISLFVGLITTVITTVLGLVIGLFAAVSRPADLILGWLSDILLAFPPVLLALGVLVVMGRSPSGVVVAMSLIYIPRTTRVARGVAMVALKQVYIEAARCMGSSTPRLLRVHVLPNSGPQMIVQSTFVFAYAILIEAGLSFIGIGIQPPTASLGNILGEARQVFFSAPWLVLLPGAWTFTIVMGINILGDALRELIDPRLSRLGHA